MHAAVVWKRDRGKTNSLRAFAGVAQRFVEARANMKAHHADICGAEAPRTTRWPSYLHSSLICNKAWLAARTLGSKLTASWIIQNTTPVTHLQQIQGHILSIKSACELVSFTLYQHTGSDRAFHWTTVTAHTERSLFYARSGVWQQKQKYI